jgi:hypothetical protein
MIELKVLTLIFLIVFGIPNQIIIIDIASDTNPAMHRATMRNSAKKVAGKDGS